MNYDQECADRELALRAEQLLKTLGYSEEEIDIHLTGNNLQLAADIFCGRRGKYIMEMVREEYINALYSIWSQPLKTLGVEVVEDIDNTHDQSMKKKPINMQHRVSTLQHIFPQLTRDKKAASHRENLLEQYSNICEVSTGERENLFSNGAALPDAEDPYKKRSTFSNHDNLSVSPGFPSTDVDAGMLADVVPYETDWFLGHKKAMIAMDENEAKGLGYADESVSLRVKHMDSYLFVSPILQGEILPLYDFRTDATFECFNFYMPQQVYYGFRIGSQVVRRLCELCPNIDETPNILVFTNSYFQGEFAEVLVAALYQCPLIKGLNFTRAGQFPAPKWDNTDTINGGDDNEAEHLAYLTGNAPSSVTMITFDNVLSELGVTALVEALKLRGRRGSLHNDKKEDGVSKQQHSGDCNAQIQSDDDCSDVSSLQILAITHSPHLGPKSLYPLINLLGFPVNPIQSRLNRPPLSLLKALDLSGNKLGDEACAHVLSIVYRKNSCCSLERLGLRGNDLGTADHVLAILTNHVKQYREAIWNKSSSGDGNYNRGELWHSPLTKLDLSQNNLSESTAARLLNLIRGDALKLQSLNLSKNGLTGDKNDRSFFNGLVDAIYSKSNAIIELNLSENNFSPSFVYSLVQRLSRWRSGDSSTLAFLHMHDNDPPLTETDLDTLHKFLITSRTEKLRHYFSSQSKHQDKNATNSSNDLAVRKSIGSLADDDFLENQSIDFLQHDNIILLDESDLLKYLDLECKNSKTQDAVSVFPDANLCKPPAALNRAQSSALGLSAATYSSLQRADELTSSNLPYISPCVEQTTSSPDTASDKSAQSLIGCGSPESVDNVSKMLGMTNEITVLYSAPLVWFDTVTRSYLPIAMLDFEMERELLMQCFEEARKNIKLCFNNATVERLQAAVTKTSNCLHFSGHGHPNSLVFEDGRGGLHKLSTDQIKHLISSGAKDGVVPFQLVFVSACHSGLTGETFVKAGIPHVVCCQQESQLMDCAALAFTRAFYLALAIGRTVKDSFEIGCQAVLVTPSVPHCESEMKKFLLLPKDGNHDKPIFNAKYVYKWPIKLSSSQSVSSSFSGYSRDDPRYLPIPTPPQGFLGREVDMYRTLNAVLNQRLVNVIGDPGIGRSSMVAALCHYINDRKNTMIIIDKIIYVRRTPGSAKGSVSSFILSLHELLVSANMASPLPKGANVDDFFQVITKALSKTKTLIVFDKTEKLEGSVEEQQFALFLDTLFRETKKVRVLMTSCKKLGMSYFGGVGQHVLTLGPLNLKNTVRLFGILCPHLHTGVARIKLMNLLVPNEIQGGLCFSDKRITARSRAIFKHLGDGIPSKTFEIAYDMSKEKFGALIKLARNTNDRMDSSYPLFVQLGGI